MPRDHDDDKPKRSWREIDQMKDRSKHRTPERSALPPQKSARAEAASKQYKSQLDAFFDGSGKAPEALKDKIEALTDSSPEGKERAAAQKAIKDAGTSAAAQKATSDYLSRWELPPDFDVLAGVLLSADEGHVRSALEVLSQMFDDKRVPKRVPLLEQRLRRVKTLSDEPDLEKMADELVRRLRLFS